MRRCRLESFNLLPGGGNRVAMTNRWAPGKGSKKVTKMEWAVCRVSAEGCFTGSGGEHRWHRARVTSPLYSCAGLPWGTAPGIYVFDLFSGTLKGCDERGYAFYYWQVLQRNSHFIWNPGVVWGIGGGLMPAELQGMWSAHNPCSQSNTQFANGVCHITWWDMRSPEIKAGLYH